MKRSEAIKKLDSVLWDVFDIPNTHYINHKYRDTYASYILSQLEEMGMLPPIEPGRAVSDLDLGAPEWEEE
jgi:hypothetical protein